MTKPLVAKKGPYAVDVEEGKAYWWCACGKSANQPFCDGSHKGMGITPQKHVASKTGKIYFCGCKASQNGALCDGAHKSI